MPAYLLSARLEVDGVREFVNDLDKATDAAKRAADQLKLLDKVSVSLTLKGVDKFLNDLEKATTSARGAVEHIRDLDGAEVRLKVTDADKFIKDVREAAETAKRSGEEIDRNREMSVRMFVVDGRGFVEDLRQAEDAVRSVGQTAEFLRSQAFELNPPTLRADITPFVHDMAVARLEAEYTQDVVGRLELNPVRLRGDVTSFVHDIGLARQEAEYTREVFDRLELNPPRVRAEVAPLLHDLGLARQEATYTRQVFDSLESDPPRLRALGVGDLVGDLALVERNAREADAALRSMDGAGNLSRAADEASRLHKMLDKIARGAVYSAVDRIFDAIVDGALEATREILAFDEAIVNAMSIQPQNMPLRKGFEDLARSLSKELGIPVSNIAEGFYHLASAGFDAEQQLKSIDDIARFAKAGMFDMEDATHKAAQAYAIFEPAGYSMKRILELLAESSNISQGSIETFSEALTNKAGTAAVTFGQSLESTLGVLSAFAQRGIEGKTAGEQYAIVLRDMRVKATANGAAFERMGIQVFDSQGNMRDLIDIAADMSVAFQGLSDKQMGAALASLGFTQRTQSALMTMLAAGDAAGKFRDHLEDTSGTIDRMVAVQLTSLQSHLDRLKASSIDLAITGLEKVVEAGKWLKETFEPALRAAAPAAEAFARGFGAVALEVGKFVGDAVVRSLELIAGLIEEVGGFASEHTEAVYLFGAALATFTAAKGIESVLGTVAPVIGNVAGAAKIATGHVVDLGKALVGRDMVGARTALGNLVGGISPLTVALGAASVAAGYYFLKMKQDADDARERVDLLTEEMIILGIKAEDVAVAIGAIRGGVKGDGAGFLELKDDALEAIGALLESEIVARNAGQSFGNLGVDIDTAAAALATGTDIFDTKGKTLTGMLHDLRDASKEVPGPVGELAGALVAMHDNGLISRDALWKLLDALDETADAADDAFDSAAEYARQQLNAALATGRLSDEELASFGIKDMTKAKTMEIVSAYEQYEGAALRAEGGVKRFNGTAKDMAGAMIIMAGEAANAEDDMGEYAETVDEAKEAFDQLKTSMEALVEGPLSAFDAETGFQASMADLVEKTKEFGLNLDASSKAGRDVRDSLSDLIQKGQEWATAQAQGDPRVYAQKWNEARDAIIDLLTPLAGSREAAEKLVAQFNLIPAEIPVDIPVTTDLSAAKTEMDFFAKEERSTTVTANANTEPAETKLGLTANAPRFAGITAYAHTEPADIALDNIVVAVRTAFIGTIAPNAPQVNEEIDRVGRNRTAGIGINTYGAAQANLDLNWVGRYREMAIKALAWTAQANYDIDRTADDRYATIYVSAQTIGSTAAQLVAGFFSADGGVVDYYANGGMRENHVAQIAPAGSWRVWAEPETGGESYIPLAAHKRKRSMEIWRETGRRLGASEFANGGISYSATRFATGAGAGRGVTIAPGAIAVNVSAAVGADGAQLSRLITESIKPALDEFALDLSVAIQRRQS